VQVDPRDLEDGRYWEPRIEPRKAADEVGDAARKSN
jgi:hypothetical protein